MFISSTFNELVKKYRENRLAHAYLIETNNYDLVLKDLKEFLKIINCPHEYKENCQNCNLCNLINIGNLPSIKIIEPDGTTIKKSQMLELKENYRTKPLYSKYNTYIIKNTEKLNSSSANSMLKFIEEPTDGILGFFLTNNKDVIIETIKSRCQNLVINYKNKKITESLDLNEERYTEYIKFIPNYLNKIASNELINNKTEILNTYPERKDINDIFQIVFQIYYETFLKINSKEYQEDIVNIYKLEEKNNQIVKKLNIISKFIGDLSYNVNMEQRLDKFVIEMRDCNG